VSVRGILLAVGALAVGVAVAVAYLATPEEQPPAPVIIAAGDIACDPANQLYAGDEFACRHRETADLLAGRELAAVLPLGDLQYEDGSLEQFEAAYKPTWGRYDAISRPIPGNHEYDVEDAAGYFDYFNGIGEASGRAGERGQGWYSYDVGAWHLIALNSNCDYIDGGCEEGSPQNDWLENDLEEHPSSCTLAYWHHARFSSGDEHGDSARVEAFWEDLDAADADLILSGHDHLYERFAPQTASGAADPNGIRQFTVGTGGDSLRGFGEISPNSEVRQGDSLGVLELTLESFGYDWRFLPAAGEDFTDSGSGTC